MKLLWILALWEFRGGGGSKDRLTVTFKTPGQNFTQLFDGHNFIILDGKIDLGLIGGGAQRYNSPDLLQSIACIYLLDQAE